MPLGSRRWRWPGSAQRNGRSRYDQRWSPNKCAWPGQFIGLKPNSRPSYSATKMFSLYLPQWPDVRHSSDS